MTMLLVTAARAQVAQGASVVTAIATGTSATATLARAFDAAAETAWCPGAKDTEGTLTLRFARVVRIKRLRILVGKMDLEKSPLSYHPPSVEVRLDDRSAQIDPTENGRNPLEVKDFRGKQGQTISVGLKVGLPIRQDRCLTELEVDLEEGAWLIGVGDEAARTLPAFIEDLTKAFRTCDRSTLNRLVRFPLVRRELEAGFANADLYTARGSAPAYRTLRDLARHCNQLVFPENDDEPLPLRPLGLGGFRVTGGTGAGVTYWDLTWIKDHWTLSRIAFTSFE